MIVGFVVDTAFRPLGAATVTILDGALTGTAITTGADGQFSLQGPFDRATRFRADKEGHVSATQTWSCSVESCPGPTNATPWLGFYLNSTEPPVDIRGDYSLTFAADSSCVGLPDEAKGRTYAATIAPAARPGPNIPAASAFELMLGGAAFLGRPTLTVGVAGDQVAFWLHGRHDAALVEQLGADTYLAFSGSATASRETTTASTISASFDGWIEYCATASAMGADYSCANARVRTQCDSQHHSFVLTRR